MPSRKIRNSERTYRDTAHPLNREVRKELTEAVLDAYEDFLQSEK